MRERLCFLKNVANFTNSLSLLFRFWFIAQYVKKSLALEQRRCGNGMNANELGNKKSQEACCSLTYQKLAIKAQLIIPYP